MQICIFHKAPPVFSVCVHVIGGDGCCMVFFFNIPGIIRICDSNEIRIDELRRDEIDLTIRLDFANRDIGVNIDRLANCD
jgi:hypothetical protein